MVSPERLEILQIGWVRLMGGWGVEPVTAYPVFDRLVAAYTEPHRRYHTLEHIGEMLKTVGKSLDTATAASAGLLMTAVWFHDAVYDPTRSDNESRSAEWAERDLAEIGLPTSAIVGIAHLIRITDHRTEPALNDACAQVLLDADLAILAADDRRYRRYADAVREEYRHVSDPDYRAGRIRVLQQFLDRPKIYRTARMTAEGESAARANLSAEIERLRSE